MSKEDGRLCGNCRFCTPYATAEYGDPSFGFCRRRAPLPGPATYGKAGAVHRSLAEFPLVYKADTYCFEHEPAGEETGKKPP